MTREELIAKLRDAILESATEEIDLEAVTEDTEIETLGFDSLSILDLVYEIQHAFGLELQAEDMMNIRTVRQLVDYISAQLEA